jgi:voltage-gated potassium channel
LTRSHDRKEQLAALPLLMERDEEVTLLPAGDFSLQTGDQVLYCGLSRVQSQMLWTVNNHNVLRYVISGKEDANGYLWKKLFSLPQRSPP